MGTEKPVRDLRMSDLHLVVFDMDGTLIDSQAFILTAMKRAFAKAGFPAPKDSEVLAIVGLSLEEAVSTIMPALNAREARDAANLYRDSFVELRAERGGEASSTLYPGARAALERLHAQDETLLGVATGKARRGLDHAYESHDLGRFFVTSQTADDHPSKPHPSMLERALYETGCEAERAVMIGDTEFDIAMGAAAGFSTIAVSWGYHPLERLAQADYLIDDFAGLDAVLADIWSK